MAKYKKYSYDQGKFIPIQFDRQIVPGTFEYTLSYLVDNEIDLSVFEQRYKNDETGAPAYDPAIMLKIVLFAYSRGIVSSRKIARCCRENVIFMALSADTRPHFTTIADFVSCSGGEIATLFSEVLLICDEMQLIGKEMFAIDGCKLPSNASKEWSGTKAEFGKKKKKMERAVRRILQKHREMDKTVANEDVIAADRRYVETLRSQIRKIKEWMDDNDDKPGKSGKPIKSNVTDNDSAKMKSSNGVIQGYDGVASVDSKHQVVVHAEAFGKAQEHDLLEPMIEGTRENFQAINSNDNVFEKTKLTADAGFHTEANMKMLAKENIDGYVADILFRKRDPRFVDRDRYKTRHRQEQKKMNKTPADMFTVEDFTFSEDKSYCLCPAGKRLSRSGDTVDIGNFRAIRFRGLKSLCSVCEIRSKCLKHPERTELRQVYCFVGRSEKGQETYTQKMKYKIDSTLGRFIYSKRIGTVEPVFANIRNALGLDRFTLRGKRKVDTQWKLYCIVHNLLKVHRYGIQFE